MKFSIKDFSSKCDQIRRKLQIWSHLLKKSLMENFFFSCSVWIKKCFSFLIHFILSLWNFIAENISSEFRKMFHDIA